MSDEGRKARYLDAIYDVTADHPMWIGQNGLPLGYNPDREARMGDFVEEAARAVVAVADAELAELRANAEGWREVAAANAGTIDSLTSRLEAAEAEREALRERLARVEAVRAQITDHTQALTEGPLIGRIKVAAMLDRALAP